MRRFHLWGRGIVPMLRLHFSMIQHLKNLISPVNAGAPGPESSHSSHGNGVVLLVDDEPEMLVIGRIALEQIGYKVLEAGDGLTALALCKDRANGISLVISDVLMPKLDGFTLVRQLHGFRPEMPVILLSGHIVEEDLWGDSVSQVRYLPKPYHLQDLQHAVIDMLGPVLSEST